ncbi:MAG: hypothetical protein SV760_08330 [Halobacteria archaeon]|nr:hypothetical protein [Halobacteria archaeon]
MIPEAWVYGSVLVALIHLVIVLYFSRDTITDILAKNAGKPEGSDLSDAETGNQNSGVDTDPSGLNEPAEEHVRCSDCGAVNETEYRFCRRCVSELPGKARRNVSDSLPDGRSM